MSSGNWVEVVVTVSVALAEAVAADLVEEVAAARSGVEVRKNKVVFWVDEKDVVAAVEATRKHLESLTKKGWQLERAEVSAGKPAPESEWRDAWKQHFHVTRLTRQVVVVPSWERYEPLATDVCIALDPGQAFGTGAHASTQLVLQIMQELADRPGFAPERVLDVGTGSGILAIAAALFWPECYVLGNDIEDAAILATRENAANNGVGERIEVSLTPVEQIREAFPLVLANIQAHILRPMRDVLSERVAPGGSLLLSGILTPQIEPLCEFFRAAGFSQRNIVPSEINPEWSAAHLVRS